MHSYEDIPHLDSISKEKGKSEMSLLIYAFKRILWLIPVLLCVTLILYALIDMAPGTIVDSMITDEMTQEDIQMLRELHDLDKPLIYRYAKYIWGLLNGNLGNSERSGISVWGEYIHRFPRTLYLGLWSIILGVILGVPLGIFAAKHAGTILDNLTTSFSLIGLSMPPFWLGVLLLIWFSFNLKWLPNGYDGTWKGYVLPVIAGGFAMSSAITRQTRSAILEVVRMDYLRTARSKGVSEIKVTTHHTLRNAWLPIITQTGMMVGMTLAGSAIVETVYTWPGVGRLMVDAVSARDTTMACGCIVLTSIMYVLILLVVDIFYALVDPRIKAMYSPVRKREG